MDGGGEVMALRSPASNGRQITRAGGIEEALEGINHQAADAGACFPMDKDFRIAPWNGVHGLEKGIACFPECQTVLLLQKIDGFRFLSKEERWAEFSTMARPAAER